MVPESYSCLAATHRDCRLQARGRLLTTGIGFAIAVFYAIGTLAGAGAPTLFGVLVDKRDPMTLFLGYVLASGLMLGAAVIARVYGVAAERRSLEALIDD